MPGTQPITIEAGPGVELSADLHRPDHAVGTVLFAHGSGSSRHSPRNRAVAERLNASGLETILLDLLTPAEDDTDRLTSEHRFDIPLLAQRVVAAVDWTAGREDALPIGLFGASTGAAAALVAAARRPQVGAVVSRGGRPDLAGDTLESVQAPTLLIVGGDDPVVVDLNRRAAAWLGGDKVLEIVPGAGHLFEEPGALETVSELAAQWFRRHLGPPPG